MMSVLRTAEMAFALFGLFFMSGTLNSYLSEPGAISAPLVQAVGGVVGLYSALAILVIRGSLTRIFGNYWPALLPVLFTLLSLIWSEDSGLTIRRAGALCLTTAFAFWLVLRYTPKQIFGMVVAMAACIIVANFVVIQLQPERGIHQVYDLINTHHAGSWRGLFGHKNDFGRLIAMSASILVVGVFFKTWGRYLSLAMLPLLGLAALMIVNSNSSQATLLGVSVPFVTLVFLWMRRLTPTGRSMLFLMVVPIAIISVMSVQLLLEYVLGLLGRDATLTGRTEIWEGVLLAMGSSALLGGGYGAGWQVVGPRLTALTGTDVGHAHNGYLDLAVDIGFLGLIMTLSLMVWLGVLAFRNLMKNSYSEMSALALAVLAFAFIGNVAGSFLLLHNSTYWVLLVVTFAVLRDAPMFAFRNFQQELSVTSGRPQRMFPT